MQERKTSWSSSCERWTRKRRRRRTKFHNKNNNDNGSSMKRDVPFERNPKNSFFSFITEISRHHHQRQSHPQTMKSRKRNKYRQYLWSASSPFFTYFSLLFGLHFNNLIIFFGNQETRREGCLQHIDKEIIGQNVQLFDFLSLDVRSSGDSISNIKVITKEWHHIYIWTHSLATPAFLTAEETAFTDVWIAFSSCVSSPVASGNFLCSANKNRVKVMQLVSIAWDIVWSMRKKSQNLKNIKSRRSDGERMTNAVSCEC